MENRINPHLIVIGRQWRGMNQETLAGKAGLNQGHLSRIENGLTEPSEEVLKRIADALDFPEGFFRQQDMIYGLPVSIHPMMHRKKASTPQKAIDHIFAESNIRLMHIRRLLQAYEMTPARQIPKMDPDEYNGDIEGIADLVRRSWNIPPGPLGNIANYLETAGCLVIWCDFSRFSVDGVTLTVPDLPPCIFINRYQPSDRMRFTLAHELGHLVMHRLPVPEMEDQADTFASAFLMPGADIRKSLTGKVTLQALASLKPLWRVSMQALLMRAQTVGIISQGHSKGLWKQINMHGIRYREPAELDFAPDEPRALAGMLRMHTDQLSYSSSEICRMLHVRVSDFRTLYQPATREAGNGLRVVK